MMAFFFTVKNEMYREPCWERDTFKCLNKVSDE